MKELQRGERTAAALEGHLDSLEKKIEELLAQAENSRLIPEKQATSLWETRARALREIQWFMYLSSRRLPRSP
jgi:hypothetical protein